MHHSDVFTTEGENNCRAQYTSYSFTAIIEISKDGKEDHFAFKS